MNRLRPREEDRHFIRRLGLVVFVSAVVVFVVRASDLLLLVFGAMLGAVLISAVANWLAARTPLPRGGGVAVAAVLLIAFFATIGWLFGDETLRQAGKLKQTLPGDWARLRMSLEGNPIGKLLTDSLGKGTGGSGIAKYAIGAGWGTLELFANFLIILAGSIFFAAQPGVYRRGLVLLVPPSYREVAASAIHDVGEALKLWLLTQVCSMVLMGVMIGLGLWWSGVEAPVALGLLGGLSEFIPYVGPTLAMVPAIIVAAAGQGSIWGVLATYLVVRVVQANVITPLISQRLVSVPPGLYLFLILAAGYAFGTFGLFFAGALAVTAYTLTVRLLGRETYGDDVAVPGAGSGNRTRV
ncbi:AI-2E family transporter [Sphingomonas sp.]|uniref:AI-2E family transporter n=1 Tax=Sphingomonas sp. TaxID=28214 RepID=UPI003B002A68